MVLRANLSELAHRSDVEKNFSKMCYPNVVQTYREKENMRRYKLMKGQSARLGRLLHMDYTVHELAKEIDCCRHKIENAIRAGCPHRRTPTGRIRIVGDEFRDWYREIIRKRKRPMGSNEAFCLSCKQAVPLTGKIEVHSQINGVERVTSECPLCGSTVNRYRKVVVS
jgi:hypothetical protein